MMWSAFVFIRNNLYCVSFQYCMYNVHALKEDTKYLSSLFKQLIKSVQCGDVFAHDVGPFKYSYCALQHPTLYIHAMFSFGVNYILYIPGIQSYIFSTKSLAISFEVHYSFIMDWFGYGRFLSHFTFNFDNIQFQSCNPERTRNKKTLPQAHENRLIYYAKNASYS